MQMKYELMFFNNKSRGRAEMNVSKSHCSVTGDTVQ